MKDAFKKHKHYIYTIFISQAIVLIIIDIKWKHTYHNGFVIQN